MKTILAALLFLIYQLPASAQITEQFYDWNWKLTEPATARFYAVTQKQDSIWHRQDYFIHENKLQMDGYYKDADAKVEHGLFRYYHPSGQLESTGHFNSGKRDGVWLRYHQNGMLADSVTYTNGAVVGTRLSWFANGFLSDSSYLKADGSGTSITWFDNGNPSAAGRYAAGSKPQGKWQYFHKNGVLSAIEIYEGSQVISKNYFDESGAVLSDIIVAEQEAEFPGGIKAWQKHLLKHLYFPTQYKLANADKAVVVVSWVINEDGTVSDVNVTTPLHPKFDAIAKEAVLKSPKWQPAQSHNRTVKAYRRQPVTFSQ